MILTQNVEISVRPNNRDYLLRKGYPIISDKCLVKVEDLQPFSRVEILISCDVCGDTKEIIYSNYHKSISKNGIYACKGKCSNVKKKITNLKKFGKEWSAQNEEIKKKIIKTNLERYGVANGRTKEKTEHIKSKSREKWGVDYYSQTEEAKEKTKTSNLFKWGVEYPQMLNIIKEKIKETNLKKFGVDNPMKNKDIRNKVITTKFEKWGDVNYNNREKFKSTLFEKYGMFYTQTEEYREKSKKTSLLNWGFENPMKSEIVQEKVKHTKFEKFGDCFFNNIEKTKITNLSRWGVEFSLSNGEIRKKIKQTNLAKYGVENIIELDEVKKKRIDSFNSKNRKYALDTYRNLISDKYEIIDYIDNLFIIQHEDHQFTSSLHLLYDRMKYSKSLELCTVCNPLNSNSSCHEKEMGEWLSELTTVELKNRKLLNGYELDIFIPEKRLAIEFNGIYWHSELFKDKYYHINKTNKCSEIGIDLIHIFEDDWREKNEIVKSIIKNRLGITENRIYARNCQIKKITTKQAKVFLDKNHIQGYSRSKDKIGLFFNNELVSVMTFGMRNINAKLEFELIRFCNKLNWNVVGGASKLFSYFIKESHFRGCIVSYADISLFSGRLYENLGFKKIHTTKPNYFWIVESKRQHRFKYNKKKLTEKFNFDENKTEVEIMKDLGYYRIWSCGQIRYEIYI